MPRSDLEAVRQRANLAAAVVGHGQPIQPGGAAELVADVRALADEVEESRASRRFLLFLDWSSCDSGGMREVELKASTMEEAVAEARGQVDDLTSESVVVVEASAVHRFSRADIEAVHEERRAAERAARARRDAEELERRERAELQRLRAKYDGAPPPGSTP